MGRARSARTHVSWARGHSSSRFLSMSRARTASSRFASSCFPGPGPAETAACTARRYLLLGRSPMRSTRRTVAGYILEVIEPIAMFAVIGLALWSRPRSSRKGFLILVSIALAFMGARRLNNAIVAWTDLMDLRTYSWLASWMWVPTVAFWTLAWNRWCVRPWRSIDVAAVLVAVVGIVGVVTHAANVTAASRLASIALFVVIAVRIIRERRMRILALVTLASILASFFGSELLDPLGVPGIWFPFGIGVSRTQYIYAIAIPLAALLVARTRATAATSTS